MLTQTMSKAIKHGQQNGFLIRVSVAKCGRQSFLLFKRNVSSEGGAWIRGAWGLGSGVWGLGSGASDGDAEQLQCFLSVPSAINCK